MNLLGFRPFVVDVVEQGLCIPGHGNLRRITQYASVIGEQEDSGCWQDLREESSRPECAVPMGPCLARMVQADTTTIKEVQAKNKGKERRATYATKRRTPRCLFSGTLIRLLQKHPIGV